MFDVGKPDSDGPAVVPNDVELVGHSYRALLDGAAYDELVDAWNRRMESAAWRDAAAFHFDGALLAQLAEIDRLASGKLQIVDRDPADELLSRCAAPAMVQNSEGRIIAINAGGRQAFALQPGDIDHADWLAPAHLGSLRQLRGQAAERGNANRRVLECVDPRGGVDDPRMLLAEARLVTLPGYPQPLTLVRSLEFAWLETTSDLIEQSWGLTEAEGEIARLFYAYRSLQRIASLRGVSVQTIQTQFKSVLAKSGCKGQIELIRVLTALCIQGGIDAEPDAGEWVNPYRNERIIARPGGRSLAYSLAGPKHGRPFIWLHGPVFNYALPRPVLDALDSLQVRLIIPCRPGYGHSEADMTLSAEEDNVDALLALARHLDLSDCPAIGTTNAATMLLLARDRAPRQFGRIGLISNFWKLEDEAIRQLTPVHRVFFKLAVGAPQLLTYMTSLGMRLIRRHGPEWYVERAHGFNPHNQQALRSMETQALLRTDTRAMMLQNGAGFARDLALAFSDPGPALERSGRSDIWCYGEGDSHAPDCTSRKGTNRLEVRIVPAAGDLLLYQAPEAICTMIADLCL